MWIKCFLNRSKTHNSGYWDAAFHLCSSNSTDWRISAWIPFLHFANQDFFNFQLSDTYERNLISLFQVAEEAYSFEEQEQIDLNISPICQRNAESCSNFITIEQSLNLSYHNVRRCCSLSSSWEFLIGCQSTWRFRWNHRENTLVSPVICSIRR